MAAIFSHSTTETTFFIIFRCISSVCRLQMTANTEILDCTCRIFRVAKCIQLLFWTNWEGWSNIRSSVSFEDQQHWGENIHSIDRPPKTCLHLRVKKGFWWNFTHWPILADLTWISRSLTSRFYSVILLCFLTNCLYSDELVWVWCKGFERRGSLIVAKIDHILPNNWDNVSNQGIDFAKMVSDISMPHGNREFALKWYVGAESQKHQGHVWVLIWWTNGIGWSCRRKTWGVTKNRVNCILAMRVL